MKDHLTLDDEFFDLPEAEAVAFLSDPAVDPDVLEEAAEIYMNLYNDELLEFWDAMPLIKAIVSNPGLALDRASAITRLWIAAANVGQEPHEAHAALLESLAANPAMSFGQLTSALADSEDFANVVALAYGAVSNLGVSYPMGGKLFETPQEARALFVILRDAAQRLGVSARMEEAIAAYEATFSSDRHGQAEGTKLFWSKAFMILSPAAEKGTNVQMWSTLLGVLYRVKAIHEPELLADFQAPAFFRLVADYSLVPMPLP